VALIVGVDRSTVSRHVKNHVLPRLAETVLVETTDVAFGNLVETFERIHAEYWRLYFMAEAAGDVKLAHSILNDIRKLVEVLVRFAPKMKDANLQDLIGRDEAAEFRHYEQVREELVAKLENMLGRHRANLPHGDEDLNSEEVRAQGRTIALVNQHARSAAVKATVDEDDELDASDEMETLPEAPPRPASSPTDKRFGPLTGFEKAEWDI
jgi:hypothetical protein